MTLVARAMLFCWGLICSFVVLLIWVFSIIVDFFFFRHSGGLVSVTQLEAKNLPFQSSLFPFWLADTTCLFMNSVFQCPKPHNLLIKIAKDSIAPILIMLANKSNPTQHVCFKRIPYTN